MLAKKHLHTFAGFAVIFALVFAPLEGATMSSSKTTQQDDTYHQAVHLLHRTTFGPTNEQVNMLAKKGSEGLNAWLSQQLHPDTIDDQAVDQKLQHFSSLHMDTKELYDAYPKGMRAKKDTRSMGKPSPKQITTEMTAQKLIRAVESKRQLQEVLVDFWFNHFNVNASKGAGKWMIVSYERDVIRPHVFGRFEDLLRATAQSPAMLFYLDNFQSVKQGGVQRKASKNKGAKGINENYARELLELHTLGVDGGYTQADVEAVARILTGWTFRKKPNVDFYFRAKAHDQTAKTVMGQTYPAGKGVEEGLRLLEFLAHHPSTAQHIARKLATRFISDQPPQTAVDALAKEFLRTKGDLRAVYQKLFSLDAFWDPSHRRAKIKKPFHFVASCLRSVDAELNPNQADVWRKIDRAFYTLGERPYRAQPPTGYKDTADFWVNPGALVARIQLGLRLTHRGLPTVRQSLQKLDATIQSKNKDTTKEALAYLNQTLLFGDVAEGTMTQIAAQLENNYPLMEEDGTDLVPAMDVPQLVGLLFGSPEFQRY